jgi:hypothetical protein
VPKYSTERFILYRENPYRVLHMGGLGFITPPSKTDLSAMPKSRREKFHQWLFIDKATASQLAASMNASSRDHVFVRSVAPLPRAPSTAPSPSSPTSRRGKSSPARGTKPLTSLEKLA